MATRDNILEEINQYHKTLGLACSTDESALERLLLLSDLTDSLADEFDAEKVSYIVDPKIKHGYVIMEVIDLVFSNGRSHYFFDGIRDADFVGFDKSSNGELRVSFGVKNLWVI